VDLLVVGAPTHLLSLSSGPSRWLQAQYWGSPDGPRRARRPHGSPTSSASLRRWLRALVVNPPVPRAAVFDTRIPGPLVGGAGRVVARRLRARGLELVAAPRSFAVEAVAGPLARGELARAAAWGRELAESAAPADV